MKAPENLFQRGETWWILYYANGRRVRRSLGTTSVREAKRMRDEILGKRTRSQRARETFGIVAEDAGPVPTFEEVCRRYLAHREASAKVAPQTLAGERGKVHNWLLPHFGLRVISTITHEDVELFIGTLRRAKAKKGDKRLGRTQVTHVFRALNRVFRFALRRGLYQGANPCDLERSERPQPGPGRDVVLTDGEVQRLLAELGPDSQIGRMATLSLYTGLRWGEVCGLAWADVDLDDAAPTIAVRRSYQGPPKNAASAATIKIHTELAAMLRRWKTTAAGEWLFPSKWGTPRRRMSGADRTAIHEAASRAQIAKNVTPHVFRHTFGSRLYEATGDAKVVQALMRHGSIKTTLEVYVHDRRDQAEQVNRMPAFPAPSHLRAV